VYDEEEMWESGGEEAGGNEVEEEQPPAKGAQLTAAGEFLMSCKVRCWISAKPRGNRRLCLSSISPAKQRS
jgi:hypothetical protein